MRIIHTHKFLIMVGMVVYYTYYERVYFSLFEYVLVIQIDSEF